MAPEVPKYSGVDLLDVLLIAVAGFFSLILAAAFASIVLYLVHYPRAFNPKELSNNALFVIPTQVAAYLLIVSFMALLVWIRHNQNLSQAIHWNLPAERLALLALGAGSLMGLCSEVASTLLQPWTPKSLPIEEFFKTPASGYLLAAFGVLVAPLVEELFFRGFLYPALERWTGATISIIITAAAFASMHGAQLAYAWAPLMVLFGVGLVLTIIRVKSGSVATCVIVHMGYNLTLFILLFFVTGGFHHMERA
ncbi:MAG TPA: type II CAAX endopeptidase family protein [Candidatus Angelobacter sp.]|nr:type II CAAX endopeptidase family protein [Candidatus Angelobacter sp.]